MRILIVEDEEAMANGLKFNFEQEGYEVSLARDGHVALELIQQADRPVDLVVLDLMLPGMSGYETCRKLREIESDLPVMVLSARTLSEDKALAFDSGTDQYVTKPFALPELLSRVRNLLERRQTVRSAGAADRTSPIAEYEFNGVRINFQTFELTVGGQTHNLTTMEMQLLRYFIEHEGIVLSRSQILRDVWEQSAEITSRSIDNFVMRLRRLIEPDPSRPRHLLSVRGTGYRFVSRPDDATGNRELT